MPSDFTFNEDDFRDIFSTETRDPEVLTSGTSPGQSGSNERFTPEVSEESLFQDDSFKFNEEDYEGLFDFDQSGNFGPEDASSLDILGRGVATGAYNLASDVGGVLDWFGADETAEDIRQFAEAGKQKNLPPERIAGSDLIDDISKTGGKNTVRSLDWWIFNGASSIPYMVATLPAGMGAGGLAAKVGISAGRQAIAGAAGSSLVNSLFQAGGTFNDVLKKTGSREEAAAAAVKSAAINFPVGMALGGEMGAFRSAAKDVGKGAIRKAIGGGARESGQELVEGMTQRGLSGEDVLDFKQMPAEALLGFTLGGVFDAFGGSDKVNEGIVSREAFANKALEIEEQAKRKAEEDAEIALLEQEAEAERQRIQDGYIPGQMDEAKLEDEAINERRSKQIAIRDTEQGIDWSAPGMAEAEAAIREAANRAGVIDVDKKSVEQILSVIREGKVADSGRRNRPALTEGRTPVTPEGQAVGPDQRAAAASNQRPTIEIRGGDLKFGEEFRPITRPDAVFRVRAISPAGSVQAERIAGSKSTPETITVKPKSKVFKFETLERTAEPTDNTRLPDTRTVYGRPLGSQVRSDVPRQAEELIAEDDIKAFAPGSNTQSLELQRSAVDAEYTDLEASDKTVRVSSKRGDLPKTGLAEDQVPLARLDRVNRRIWQDLSDETGTQFTDLKEIAPNHTVSYEVYGDWEGVEPGFAVNLPNATVAQADRVASILGQKLRQKAAVWYRNEPATEEQAANDEYIKRAVILRRRFTSTELQEISRRLEDDREASFSQEPDGSGIRFVNFSDRSDVEFFNDIREWIGDEFYVNPEGFWVSSNYIEGIDENGNSTGEYEEKIGGTRSDGRTGTPGVRGQVNFDTDGRIESIFQEELGPESFGGEVAADTSVDSGDPVGTSLDVFTQTPESAYENIVSPPAEESTEGPEGEQPELFDLDENGLIDAYWRMAKSIHTAPPSDHATIRKSLARITEMLRDRGVSPERVNSRGLDSGDLLQSVDHDNGILESPSLDEVVGIAREDEFGESRFIVKHDTGDIVGAAPSMLYIHRDIAEEIGGVDFEKDLPLSMTVEKDGRVLIQQMSADGSLPAETRSALEKAGFPLEPVDKFGLTYLKGFKRGRKRTSILHQAGEAAPEAQVDLQKVNREVLAELGRNEGINIGRRQDPSRKDIQRELNAVRDPGPDEPLLKHGAVEKVLSALFGVEEEPTAKMFSQMPGAPEQPVGYRELVRRVEEMINSTDIAEWYPDFGRGLRETVGVANMPEASVIFAITSPKNPVANNLKNTYDVMKVAREHLAQHGTFDGLAKSIQAMKGTPEGGLHVGEAFSGTIERFYKSGVYNQNAKTSTYASNVIAKALGEFFAFTVNDTHVAKAMGFIGEDGQPTFMDGNKASVDQYRHATYVIAKIAQDLGIEPGAAQAGLWAYSKSRMSEGSGLPTDALGTWAEAESFSEGSLAALQPLLDKSKPLAPELASRENIGFAATSGRGVTMDRKAQAEVESAAAKQKRPLVKPVARERRKTGPRSNADAFEERYRQSGGVTKEEAHSVRAVLEALFSTVGKIAGVNGDTLIGQKISDVRSPTWLDRSRAHKLTGGIDPKGQIRFDSKTEKGYVSTDLLAYADRPDLFGAAAGAQNATKIMKWATNGGDKWTKAGWEKFSRAFHRYLETKKAPTSTLQRGFDNIKNDMNPTPGEWKAAIILWEKSDVSTTLHEVGHLFRRMLSGADLDFVNEQFGVKNNEWSVEQEERFARTWERFLRSGKVTNPKLKSHFTKFKQWLTAIYHRLKGSDLKYQVSPEMTKFFNNFLSGRPLSKAGDVAPQITEADFVPGDLTQSSNIVRKKGQFGTGPYAKNPSIKDMQNLMNTDGTRVVRFVMDYNVKKGTSEIIGAGGGSTFVHADLSKKISPMRLFMDGNPAAWKGVNGVKPWKGVRIYQVNPRTMLTSGTIKSLRDAGFKINKNGIVSNVAVRKDSAQPTAQFRENDLFDMGDADLRGEEASLRKFWGDNEKARQKYKDGLMRDTEGRPKAAAYWDRLFGGEGYKGKLKTWRNKVTAEIENLHMLDVFVDMVQGPDEMNASQSPAKGARLLRGVDGLSEVVARTWAKAIGFASGARDGKGRRISGRLTGEQSRTVNDYLFLRSVIRREKVLRNKFPEQDIDSFNPAVDGRPMNAKRATAMLSLMGKRIGAEQMADLKAMEKHVGKFWRWMLNYSHDAGLLSGTKEKFKNSAGQTVERFTSGSMAAVLEQNLEHGDYVGPFDVIAKAFDSMQDGDVPPRSLEVNRQTMLQSLKGTEREISNLMESSMKKIYAGIHQAEANKVVRNLYRMRDRDGVKGDLILDPVMRDGEVQPAPDGFDTVHFFENGMRKSFYVPSEVAHVVKGLNKTTVNWLMRAAGKQSAWLRAGATAYSPTFALRNIFRDIGTQAIRADFPLSARDMDTVVKSVVSTWGGMDGKHGRDVRAWMKSGGSYASRIGQFKPTRRAEEIIHDGNLGDPFLDSKAFGTKLARFLGKAGRNLEKGAQVSEETTRMSAFYKTRSELEKAGVSRSVALLEAGLASRTNSVDFAGGGRVLQAMNFFAPFVKARARGFHTEMVGIKRNPRRAKFLFTAAAIGAATLAAANRAEWGDDMDDRMYDYLKEANWIIQIGRTPNPDHPKGYDPVFFTIPKPDWVRWIAVPIEDAVKHLAGKDVSVLETILGTTGAISPYDFERDGQLDLRLLVSQFEPPVLRAVHETASDRGWDAFRGKQLIPEGLVNVEPSEQYVSSTPQVLRTAGKMLNFSPIKMHHAIGTMFGSAAKGLLAMTDFVVGIPEDRKDQSLIKEVSRLPVVRALFSTSGGADVQRMYGYAREAEIETTTQDVLKKRPIKHALENWPKWTPEQRRKYRDTKVIPVLDERGLQIFETELRKMAKGVGKNPVVDRVRGLSSVNGAKVAFLRRMFAHEIKGDRERKAFLLMLASRGVIDEISFVTILKEMKDGTISK